MDRVYESGTAVAAPVAPATPSTGYPTKGNPTGGVPATQPGEYWYHMITEELRKVLTDQGITPDHANLSQLSQAINGIGSPVGVPAPWSTETPPTGWLECDGSLISRTTYASLFAVIGTRYGVGDGSTTFAIPDFRGEFLRGWDNGSGNDPDAASRTNRGDGITGNNVGTKQGQQLLAHNHTLNSVTEGTAGGGTSLRSGPGGVGTSTVGGNETRPRNVNVMWIIKF